MSYIERELDPNYPIYDGYWYLADGEPIQADQNTTAEEFKRAKGIVTLKSCDIHGCGLKGIGY